MPNTAATSFSFCTFSQYLHYQIPIFLYLALTLTNCSIVCVTKFNSHKLFDSFEISYTFGLFLALLNVWEKQLKYTINYIENFLPNTWFFTAECILSLTPGNSFFSNVSPSLTKHYTVLNDLAIKCTLSPLSPFNSYSGSEMFCTVYMNSNLTNIYRIGI